MTNGHAPLPLVAFGAAAGTPAVVARLAAHAPIGGAVLVVYPFCLDHVGHGNIQRILAVARYLASRGIAVDLVYQASARVDRVDDQYAAFRSVFAVEPGASSSDEAACATRLQAFYVGHELPPAHMRPSAPLTVLVRGLLEASAYRAVIATYAFTAPIFRGLRRQPFTVCDVQDVMHEHADACQRATGHASSFSMPPETEAFLWRQWDALVAITPDDKARIARDLLPGQHVLTARHAAPCATKPAAGRNDVALYAASDNQANVASVTWLLEHVWPRVRRQRPQARLRMAGLICAALPSHLRETPGLELLGFRDDLTGELSRCGVLVAPYLYGSGLKIKVVEAACAGKAIVTTSAGVAGSGLRSGRALEVHDEATPFADTVARLLGDRGARSALAESARVDAAALFSAEACYEPVVSLLRLYTAAGAARPASSLDLGTAVTGRLRIVVEQTAPSRLVVWGNGAFTRALVAAMAADGLPTPVIVDGRASEPVTSPEGLSVLPKAHFVYRPGDLVVLSSETFELDMWRDLAPSRDDGAHVLGLCHPHLVSRALVERLSGSARAAIGATSLHSRRGQAPAVIFWDSGADTPRWWRVLRERDLAAEAAAHGAVPIVACRAALASRPDELASFGRGVDVLPIVECGGEDVERRDIEGGVRGLMRAVSLAASMSANALARLPLGDGDLLVLFEPSLSECLGLARALAERSRRQAPSVAVWLTSIDSPYVGLPADARQSYWRLAVAMLAEVAGERLALVTPDADDARRLTGTLAWPVGVVGHPAVTPHGVGPAGLARVLCLGPVSAPEVRPALEALAAAASAGGPLDGVTLSWRSDQHDARLGAGERWALDLAASLGMRLLDEAPASEMADALAGADVVVMLGGAHAAWHAPVQRRAAAARVPLLRVLLADDAVAQVVEALGRRRAPPRPAAGPAPCGRPRGPGAGPPPAAGRRRCRRRRPRPSSDCWPPSCQPTSPHPRLLFLVRCIRTGLSRRTVNDAVV